MTTENSKQTEEIKKAETAEQTQQEPSLSETSLMTAETVQDTEITTTEPKAENPKAAEADQNKKDGKENKKTKPSKAKKETANEPKSILEKYKQDIRYRDRMVGLSFALLLVFAYAFYKAPSQITVYIPPDTSKSMLMRVNEIPPSSVYSFAHMFLEHLNYCPNDCKVDYKTNLDNMYTMITDQCRAALSKHLKNNEGLYAYRSRKLIPIQGETFHPNKVIQRSSNTWLVSEVYDLQENIRGKEIRTTRMHYPMRIIRTDMPIDINPYQMQFDCFETPPERVEVSEDWKEAE